MTPEQMEALNVALEPLRSAAREEGHRQGWSAALRTVHAVLVQEAVKLLGTGDKEAGDKHFDELYHAVKFLEKHFDELRNLPS